MQQNDFPDAGELPFQLNRSTPLLLTAGCPSSNTPISSENGLSENIDKNLFRQTETESEMSAENISSAVPIKRKKDVSKTDLPRLCSFCHLNIPRKKENHCAVCRLYLRSEKLVSKKLLSREIWRHFRFIFSLPEDIKQFGELEDVRAKKARFVRHLLEYFTTHCPLSKQAEMSCDDLVLWLQDHLPEDFWQRMSMFKNDDIDFQRNFEPGFQLCNEADILSDPDTVPTSPKKTKRQPITVNKYNLVAVRQGSFCYWCGIKVVREADIPVKNRLIKNKETIVYLSGDELREVAIGTIDHLLRVTDGGDNKPENLVISCLKCNLEREKKTREYGRPFARRRLPCRTCGGRFFHPDWGCCSICGAVPSRSTGVIKKLLGFITQKYKNWF